MHFLLLIYPIYVKDKDPLKPDEFGVAKPVNIFCSKTSDFFKIISISLSSSLGFRQLFPGFPKLVLLTAIFLIYIAQAREGVEGGERERERKRERERERERGGGEGGRATQKSHINICCTFQNCVTF